MTNSLFQGWTENQLKAAFQLANAELAAREQRLNSERFWRDAEYIAMLTGGAPLKRG